jgi:hypothetical protein
LDVEKTTIGSLPYEEMEKQSNERAYEAAHSARIMPCDVVLHQHALRNAAIQQNVKQSEADFASSLMQKAENSDADFSTLNFK